MPQFDFLRLKTRGVVVLTAATKQGFAESAPRRSRAILVATPMHGFWINPSEIRTIVTLALAICVLLLSSCSSGVLASASAESDAMPMLTGRVYTLAEVREMIPTMYFGDDSYAEVNSAWLKLWYGEYRAQLDRVGVVRWDVRFDCNRFVDFYSGLAQAYFYRQTFHSRTPARALALGPIWYVRDMGGGRHALIQALTERGRIFIDPQNGREIDLTPTEKASAYLQIF